MKTDNTIHSVNVSVGGATVDVGNVSAVSSEGSFLGGMEVGRGLSSSVMSSSESGGGILMGLLSGRLFGVSVGFSLLGSGFDSSGMSEGSFGISDSFVVVLLGGMSSSFGGGDLGSVVGSRVSLGLNSGSVGFSGGAHDCVGMFPFSSSLSGSSIGGSEFSSSFVLSVGSGISSSRSMLSGILGSEVFFSLLFTNGLEALVLSHVVGLMMFEVFVSSSGF